ncbi:MAG: DUF4838 domain-containing protein, partial [Bacteroidales bacterium]|nr:DUF4838 domain-containing protein [Bacteroidales bacterium]
KEHSNNILYAAELLQKDIEKVSGCKIPVVTSDKKERKKEIVIGRTDRECKRDNVIVISYGYMMESCNDRIFLWGTETYLAEPWEEEDVFTVYAVVDLLEKIGVRKFAPDCEFYPQKKTITMAKKDLNDHYAPQNTFRQIQSSFTKDNRDFKLWLKQNHYDDMFLKGYFVHTFNKLIPKEKYFDAHPEYFALINGQRHIDQICLSNDSVFEIVCRNVADLIKNNHEHKIISISQNDNSAYCNCNKCKATNDYEQSPAGTIIRFVNKVCERFPAQMFSTLAYQYSRTAPVHTKPANNLQIMLCTIEEDRNITIEESGKKGKSHFAQDLEAWSKITNNIFLWDYECNFHHSVSPFPLLHTLKPNIEFFMQNNAHQHYQQAFAETGHEFAELKTYLVSKLLWNINIDTDSIINEFLNAYYGEAAPYLRKYIDTLHYFAQQSGDFLDIYAPPTQYMNTFLNADKMEIYKDLLPYAIKESSIYTKRVLMQLLSLWYAQMEIGKVDMFGERGWYEKDGDGKFVLKQEMKQMLQDFYDVCKENNVRLLNENGLTPQQYYATTLRFIDIKIEDNKAFHKKITANPMPSNKYGGGTIDLLLNGVCGTSDHKTHWLGWFGEDTEIVIDMDSTISADSIILSSLYIPGAWILHPASVECFVSNGNDYLSIGTISNGYEQKDLQQIKEYIYIPNQSFRYIKFIFKGTKQLPQWHAFAGEKSWFFLDEVIVK